MEIRIDDNISLLAFQEEFNRVFPYLKIDFFTISNKSTGVFTRKLLDKCLRKFGEFRTGKKMDDIIITPDTTVADLENKLNSNFSLSAQVYRNSGRIWLETNATDSWTLEEQNRQGEDLSSK